MSTFLRPVQILMREQKKIKSLIEEWHNIHPWVDLLRGCWELYMVQKFEVCNGKCWQTTAIYGSSLINKNKVIDNIHLKTPKPYCSLIVVSASEKVQDFLKCFTAYARGSNCNSNDYFIYKEFSIGHLHYIWKYTWRNCLKPVESLLWVWTLLHLLAFLPLKTLS